MTRRIFALAAASALWLGTTSDARAQFSMALGNPYTGSGLYIGSGYGLGYGNPYGYGLGYNSLYGTSLGGYGLGYGAPLTSYYSSGYYGLAAPGMNITSFAPGLGYGYGSGFGYPAYRVYGYRRGFGFPGLGFRRGYFAGPRYYPY
jgi:hypothetical protein